ncbi:hypothetical protein DQ04_03141000, partial [Trypanosoma grayi]|uniref:hypothetical protein n=1 Tax=Trypanosoma grayi TaxID=71804 RepID=UPI0004F4ADC2
MHRSTPATLSAVPRRWSHATNSIAALQGAAAALVTDAAQHPIGLEVDVRVPHKSAVPVLRHDPFPPVDTAAAGCVTLSEWLETLAGIVHAQERRVGVVKLDFKEPAAARLSHQLLVDSSALYERLSLHFAFWWNADVVAAGDAAEEPSSSASFLSLPEAEVHAMLRDAVCEFRFGLSFGWNMPADYEAYGAGDVARMRGFLQRLAAHGGEWRAR